MVTGVQTCALPILQSYIVQVNGKLRAKVAMDANISREDMEKMALEDAKVKAAIEGKNVVKVIAVPKKLVNIVVK